MVTETAQYSALHCFFNFKQNDEYLLISNTLRFICSILLAIAFYFILHGEKAHSRYFGEDAFKKLKGDNKELYIVPGASHTDLYDNLEKIPFGKIVEFYNQYLK